MKQNYNYLRYSIYKSNIKQMRGQLNKYCGNIMKNYSKNTEETLVTFHIGRGGRFHNSGFLTFCEQDTTINSYTDKLFISYENESDFSNRFGWDLTGDKNQRSILDLLTDEDLDELEEKFGITEEMLGKQIYKTCGGSLVGLEVGNDGTGRIEIDNDYDTTYVCFLKDCDEKEMNLILDSSSYVSEDVKQYCREQLGIEEETENEDQD